MAIDPIEKTATDSPSVHCWGTRSPRFVVARSMPTTKTAAAGHRGMENRGRFLKELSSAIASAQTAVANADAMLNVASVMKMNNPSV